MSLSAAQEALIADRQRVWAVRRACQVATFIASQDRPGASTAAQKGDPALTALLRCLLHELHGDITAVTLLDDRTQYFLSVVPRSKLHDLDVTSESMEWYGCQNISHTGGLCVRTITMVETSEAEPVFEIFNLADGHTTRSLPVVDGTAASFRHYAGVPISLGDVRIGTLFVFKDEPAQQGLSRAHRHFMHETARQLVEQILLSVEALNSKRALRCSSAVLSLLEVCESSGRGEAQSLERTSSARDPFSHIYQNAASLLLHAFELEGVIIQERFDPSSWQSQSERLLGFDCKHDQPTPLSHPTAEQLLQSFPFGAVCHLLSEADGSGVFAASVPGSPELSKQMSITFQCMPPPEQFLFLPLWNTYHGRDTAFILGWSTASTRVYASTTDLPPLSQLGSTIMTQIRRLEEQLLDRNKSDFLGSVSHEMRSPLHGVLACIDLCRDADIAQRNELLDSASACALQLRDNIDNILKYSNIGSPTSSTNQHRQVRVLGSGGFGKPPAEMTTNVLAFVDHVIAKERTKNKSMTPSTERRTDPLMTSTFQTVITVDSAQTSIPLVLDSDLSVIIDNLVGNCLKFTGPTGCIRVSLDADETTVTMLFLDTGCGMSSDYVRHKLFSPFSQQDPLDSGMGLGLSLVHSAVKRLNGSISFHTDELEGTNFIVTLPRESTEHKADETEANLGPIDCSFLKAQVLSPERWIQKAGDAIRDGRCLRGLDAFFTSLKRTCITWCLVDLQLCTEPWSTPETIPDVVFLLHSDLDRLREVAGEAFDNTQKVVFCPDPDTEAQVLSSVPEACTTISGPIVPGKVRSAVAKCSQGYKDRREIRTKPPDASAVHPTDDAHDHKGNTESSTHPDAVAAMNEQTCSPQRSELGGTQALPIRLKTTNLQRDPKILLVDDNAINLKVAAMFARKCTQQPAVPAGGGRIAIEEFKTARSTQGFDLILLDLSMPEVSGFEVAATIRELESDPVYQHLPHAYIVALTGLVSDKDRNAAFAAGVDEYVTKPASLTDLKKVIGRWRNTRGLS